MDGITMESTLLLLDQKTGSFCNFRFDAVPSISQSGVTIVTSNTTLFSVEWRDLVVREAKYLGRFTFGVAMSILGDITFVYEKV